MLGMLTLAAAAATVSGALRQAPEPPAPPSLVFGGSDPHGVRVETAAGLAAGMFKTSIP